MRHLDLREAGKSVGGLALSGTLEIPTYDEDKYPSAWIVDGQQRALALDGCSNAELSFQSLVLWWMVLSYKEISFEGE